MLFEKNLKMKQFILSILSIYYLGKFVEIHCKVLVKCPVYLFRYFLNFRVSVFYNKIVFAKSGALEKPKNDLMDLHVSPILVLGLIYIYLILASEFW